MRVSGKKISFWSWKKHLMLILYSTNSCDCKEKQSLPISYSLMWELGDNQKGFLICKRKNWHHSCGVTVESKWPNNLKVEKWFQIVCSLCDYNHFRYHNSQTTNFLDYLFVWLLCVGLSVEYSRRYRNFYRKFPIYKKDNVKTRVMCKVIYIKSWRKYVFAEVHKDMFIIVQLQSSLKGVLSTEIFPFLILCLVIRDRILGVFLYL
jgi:hypothetical protein